MRTRKALAFFSLAALTAAGLTACGKHYRVTDPAAGTVYYTTDIDRHRASIEFEDELTGNTVMLNSSEVRQISRDEFRQNVPRD